MLPTRYSEILANSALIERYAVECAVEADPQPEIYAALDQVGVLKCFGAYTGAELAGFVSLLMNVMPHNGKRIATIESIFAVPEHRNLGTGDALLDAAEAFAAASGCAALIYTARVGSALEKVLSRRHGCEHSHAMFTRWL